MSDPPDPALQDAASLKAYLDRLAGLYERPGFVEDDPIGVPWAFDDPRDIEVIGLYAALLAWGRRSVILSKLAELCERMGQQPFRFVRDFGPGSEAALNGFKHRTFQPTDAVWLTRSLSVLLREHGSLEHVFAARMTPEELNVGPAIQGFSEAVLTAVSTPQRLRKHLARPSTGSACKRLAMYLRWMVRPGPVDFGLWTAIHPRQLVLPLDVHTGRQARDLGLLRRRQDDWKATLELTLACRAFDPEDPVRYDFALFGRGVYGGGPLPSS